jgi:hypothetical protein
VPQGGRKKHVLVLQCRTGEIYAQANECESDPRIPYDEEEEIARQSLAAATGSESFLALGGTMRKCLHHPVAAVVRRIVNPRVRGWVNYFGWGNASRDLAFVAWQVELKVRCFASRQRPKRRGGRTWTTWSAKEIYGAWGLFHDYRVLPRSEPSVQRV